MEAAGATHGGIDRTAWINAVRGLLAIPVKPAESVFRAPGGNVLAAHPFYIAERIERISQGFAPIPRRAPGINVPFRVGGQGCGRKSAQLADSFPPIFSHVPLGTYLKSSGALSTVAWLLQACLAVAQSFLPAFAIP